MARKTGALSRALFFACGVKLVALLFGHTNQHRATTMKLPRKLSADQAITVLDEIEGQIVAYMANTRRLNEAAMRKLIHEDAPTRASYERKIARAIAHVGTQVKL